MREKTVFYTLLLLLAVILPFIYHDLDLVLRAVLMACAVLGLQLLMSYGGQISLGNAAFMGLGAYISGVLSVKFGLPSLLTIFVAVAVTALIALIVGYPLLRLKGYYLALGTLGFRIVSYFAYKHPVHLDRWAGRIDRHSRYRLGRF
ncbi:branched-chain amino acid ABC transporter permease [Paenibacillus sp. tmac-D7]|uniref:branched-chain amino acid ABC transporter permease n=1 Tax=Paenibacillus sp. tmac-D7 TaxID=2591462 RepID=UPI0011449EFF|nr:branched-chain amino acid ABC transporter permease [Paenibacillus sp. tmac-D7]